MTRGSPGAFARVAVADRERDALLQRLRDGLPGLLAHRAERGGAQRELLAHDLRAQPDGRRHQPREALVAGAQAPRERRAAEQRQHLRGDADREEVLAVDRQKREDVVVASDRRSRSPRGETRSAPRARRAGSRCRAGRSWTRRRARAASELVLGCRPSLISWWIVWSRRQSGRSLNAPARPTVAILGPAAPGRNESSVRKCPRCARRHRVALSAPARPELLTRLKRQAACAGRAAWLGDCCTEGHHADPLRPRVRREPAYGRGPGGRAARSAPASARRDGRRLHWRVSDRFAALGRYELPAAPRRPLASGAPRVRGGRAPARCYFRSGRISLTVAGFLAVGLELEVLLRGAPSRDAFLFRLKADHAQVEVRVREVGLRRDGLGQRVLGFLHLALVVGLDALVVEDLGRVGIGLGVLGRPLGGGLLVARLLRRRRPASGRGCVSVGSRSDGLLRRTRASWPSPSSRRRGCVRACQPCGRSGFFFTASRNFASAPALSPAFIASTPRVEGQRRPARCPTAPARRRARRPEPALAADVAGQLRVDACPCR